MTTDSVFVRSVVVVCTCRSGAPAGTRLWPARAPGVPLGRTARYGGGDGFLPAGGRGQTAIDTTATFDDLRAFMAEPGCAVCRCASQAEDRFFQAVLYERVVDVPFRERLRASGGFCARHAQALLAYRDPLATAILYGDLLRQRRELLARWHDARLPVGVRAPAWARANDAEMSRRCMACAIGAEAQRRACAVLATGLGQGRLGEAWAGSEGLCWPHFAQARPLCGGGARRLLDEVEIRCLDGLAADVQALIDSFDYRSDGSRTAQVESAWRRAVGAVVGSLAGRPEGAGGGPGQRRRRPTPGAGPEPRGASG